MKSYSSAFFFFVIIFFFSAHLPLSNGQQISTQCTGLLLRSFTPCLNFLTGSTNGGGSPSSECCKSLGSLISSSTQCACLVVTGSVPLSVPINKTLAISLPRLCKSTSVPLQCSPDVGSPIPGPGPTSYSPSLPPLPPQSYTPPAGVGDSAPPSSTVPSSLSPPAITSPPSPPTTPADQGSSQGGSSQGLQPLILPSSAFKISAVHSSIVVMSMLAMIFLF
ncbi:proline-rich receptor-like protein kinase PERK2 [Dendrobium catenatum]|uniref:proline-rich receptor-like protein kinase PERK2 n=1 Tax=Dendrobium catenatum TaxID=906689 RepID=UPI0009F3B53A|nr:proline-rich receptor-like protein kinase PERK2 [Dendrobium catenatum]